MANVTGICVLINDCILAPKIPFSRRVKLVVMHMRPGHVRLRLRLHAL